MRSPSWLYRCFITIGVLMPALSFAANASNFFSADGSPTVYAEKFLAPVGLKFRSGENLPRRGEGPRWSRRSSIGIGEYSCVTVSLLVQPDGIPTQIALLDGITSDKKQFALWAKDVMNTLQKWRFEPSTDGARLIIPFAFDATDSGDVNLDTKMQCASPLARFAMSTFAQTNLVSNSHVNYPFPASPARESGCLVMSFDITKDGRADNFEVIATDLSDRFTDAGVTAMSGWVFKPQDYVARPTIELEFKANRDAPLDSAACNVWHAELQETAPVISVPETIEDLKP